MVGGMENQKDRVSPSFWRKVVYVLECKTCGSQLCRRGMRAILLADTTIQLYSTDEVDFSTIGVIPNTFITAHCYCKIRNIGCLSCGSVVGYHVLVPCKTCMCSCNNGHYWMFHSSCVVPCGRTSADGQTYMVWKEIPTVEQDFSPFSQECDR